MQLKTPCGCVTMARMTCPWKRCTFISNRIRIPPILESSRVNAIAAELVREYGLGNVALVEQELYYLQKRNNKSVGSILNQANVGSIQDVEKHIEGLYEDLPHKVASTRQILNLAKYRDNLPALGSNGKIT